MNTNGYLAVQGIGTILSGWGQKFMRYQVEVVNPDHPTGIVSGTVVWYEHASDGWKAVSGVERINDLNTLYYKLLDEMEEQAANIPSAILAEGN